MASSVGFWGYCVNFRYIQSLIYLHSFPYLIYFEVPKGDPITTVKMDDFIRLFVNHRPVYGIGNNDIEEAFLAFTKNDNGT